MLNFSINSHIIGDTHRPAVQVYVGIHGPVEVHRSADVKCETSANIKNRSAFHHNLIFKIDFKFLLHLHIYILQSQNDIRLLEYFCH